VCDGVVASALDKMGTGNILLGLTLLIRLASHPEGSIAILSVMLHASETRLWPRGPPSATLHCTFLIMYCSVAGLN